MSRNLPDRRQRVPELFSLLFHPTVLRVQASDAYALWDALTHARWSEAVSLRGVFVYHKLSDVHTEADGLRFLHEQLAPQRIVGVVEALVQEGLLTRATASRLETAIFSRMTPSGTWTTT